MWWRLQNNKLENPLAIFKPKEFKTFQVDNTLLFNCDSWQIRHLATKNFALLKFRSHMKWVFSNAKWFFFFGLMQSNSDFFRTGVEVGCKRSGWWEWRIEASLQTEIRHSNGALFAFSLMQTSKKSEFYLPKNKDLFLQSLPVSK